MRKFNMNNMPMRILSMVMGVALVLSSCIEEGKDEIAGKGTSLIRFGGLEEGFALVAFDNEIQTKQLVTINRDAVSSSDLNTAMSVEFEINAAALEAYNTEHGTHFELLDEAAFTFEGVTGTSFDFAKGEFQKAIQMELNPATLDLSKQYALPLLLKNPSNPYEVSAANGTAIIQVIVKNQWDGVYDYTGALGRYDASSGAPLNDGLDGPIKDGLIVDMATSGANTVDFVPMWASGGGVGGVGTAMRVTIAPDNSITMVCVGASPANWGPVAGADNYYDPDTKTFHINYKWGAAVGSPTGTTRGIFLELIYNKPR